MDKSLVVIEEQGTPRGRAVRYRMLETIREYARQVLAASGEAEPMEALHAAFFVELAERAEPELLGLERAAWLDRLDQERDNLRAAERRAVARGDAETVLRLGAALWRFWMQADAADARERVEAILALAATTPPSPARAKALQGAGFLARMLGDYPAARALGEESLAVARLLDDPRRIATALYDLGRLASVQGRYSDAHALLAESLTIYRRLEDRPGIAAALNRLGYLAFSEGDLATAHTLLQQSLAIARFTNDRRLVADALFNLGLSSHFGGNLDGARRSYEECRAIYTMVADRQDLAMTLQFLGHTAALQGDFPAARALYRESLVTARETGNWRRLGSILWAAATLAAAEGESERAVRLEAAARAATETIGALLPRPMRELWSSQLEPAHDALGEDGTRQAYEAGQAVSLDTAVDDALAWLAASTDARHTDRNRPTDASRPSERDRCQASGRTLPRVCGSANETLTGREREVVTLIAGGLSNQRIADRLVISERTSANHVHSILSKLGFKSRAQVAAWAVENGLTPQR